MQTKLPEMTMPEPLAIFSNDTFGPDGRGQYRYTLWRCGLQDAANHGGILPISSGDCKSCGYPLRAGRCACGDKSKETMQFICLNPSTADERTDDPTVLRCWRRAQRMGYGSFCMTNLFALRSTDPRGLRKHPNPIGEGAENEGHILRVGALAGMIILAWGAQDAAVQKQAAWVENRLKSAGLWPKCHALGFTAAGIPRHPLYMKNDIEPMRITP